MGKLQYTKRIYGPYFYYYNYKQLKQKDKWNDVHFYYQTIINLSALHVRGGQFLNRLTENQISNDK